MRQRYLLADSRSRPDVGEPDARWASLGGRGGHGYGQIERDGKVLRVHRVVYTLLVGPIPLVLFVCHTCDRPACVNPAHLCWGRARRTRRTW